MPKSPQAPETPEFEAGHVPAWDGSVFFDRLREPAVLVDIDSGQVLEHNRQAHALRSGHEEGFTDLVRRTWRAYIDARTGDRGQTRRAEIEMVLEREDGAQLIFDVDGFTLLYGETVAFALVFYDVTEAHRIQEALRLSEQRYALVAYGANDGLWDWDLRTNQMYYSFRWKEMLGYRDADIDNSPNEWFARIHPEDLEHVSDLIKSVTLDTQNFEIEYRMLHKNGEYRWMLTRGLTVFDAGGKVIRMAGSQTDITERRHATEELERRAFFDALTGLPNRSLFMDRLGRAAERASRNMAYRFAVLFIDLDRFKIVNDSLGHLAGDQLLIQIARRLQPTLRSNDTMARLGGDEFAVILDSLAHNNDAQIVAGRINAELTRPFIIENQSVFASASIGISYWGEGSSKPEELLREADIAMYSAKKKGPARYQVYDQVKDSRALQVLHIENDLRQAIEQNEFVLHYQPILNLSNDRIEGFEALVRWDHPRRGLIAPAEFIPVAEETNLIVDIGHWVMEEACRQLYLWHTQFPDLADLSVAVNLSSKQFSESDLVGFIDSVLAETKLKAECLKLEITESVVMENAELATVMLKKLRTRGMHLLIDDFGTGFSSLNYLCTFPLDSLKIDRSFVNRISDPNEKNLEIVRSTISLAHNLHLTVVAEGIETPSQLKRLKEFECEYGQGWLFSKALPAHEVEAMLAQEMEKPGSAIPVRAKM